MKYYPIPFNTEMVKAILEGRKTQTRRIIPLDKNGLYRCNAVRACLDPNDNIVDRQVIEVEGRYGYKRDKLWVRETHGIGRASGLIYYKTHELNLQIKRGNYKALFDKWKPSIHMFRKDSRITLEITDVRVERLVDIRLQDIWAEGIPRKDHRQVLAYRVEEVLEIRREFASLWNTTNKEENWWGKNPWVWVITFKKL